MNAKKQSTSPLLAGVVGNVLEWYDFALYGYFVPILSGLFFPRDSTIAALLATYGIFAAGFLMRPLGAVLFGYIGDRLGRREALFVSIITMAASTLLMGCLPTFASIGVAAPIALTLLRLVQGLSVGGEFTTSVTYVIETAPPQRRGLAGSWANVGSVGGSLLGAGVAALFTIALPQSAVMAWSWRVPFLLGGVFGLAALWLRSTLPESELFEQQAGQQKDELPLRTVLTRNRGELVKAILFTAGYGVFFYMPMVYLPTHANKFAGMDLGHALSINALGAAVAIPLIALAGYASDRFMRRRHLLLVAFLAMAASAYPLFFLVNQGRFLTTLAAQLGFALIVPLTLGSAPAMVAEMFPTEDRVTAYSLAYSLGLGVSGGTAPLVATWLIGVFDSNYAPAFYLMVASLVSVLALATMRDRSREALQ